MKRAKVDKLESRIELYLFVGYPKETKGGYSFSPKDNKVFVSANARFLEDDHIRNHKSNNKVVFEELDTDEIGDSTKDQNDDIIVDPPVVRSEITQIEEHPISLRHSGRVVRQPDRYMGIGDALVAIFDDHKDDPLVGMLFNVII